MAHFAEVNSYGLVLRVVVIDNNDVNANGGDQSVGAEEAVKKIVPFTTGSRWVQTSYLLLLLCRLPHRARGRVRVEGVGLPL